MIASHPAAAVRAAVGHIVVAAIERADGEIQSCGGTSDEQSWLEELGAAAPEVSHLRGHLDDPSAEVRAAALTFAALLEARAQPRTRRLVEAWSVADLTPPWGALADAEASVRAAALAGRAPPAAGGSPSAPRLPR